MTSRIYIKKDFPFDLFEIDLLRASEEQLLRVSRELGLGLNLEEMKKCKRYFSKLGRNPTDVELQSIGQTWSEHCYHKTFKGEVRIEDRKVRLFEDFIAKATKELSHPWCISVFEDNAGVVDFERGYGIAAKVETHNHPSAIDPFAGAATGLGGLIRDIMGVWAQPIASIGVFGVGPQDHSQKLPPGMKHPKTIFKGVLEGVRQYGIHMKIPNVDGAIYFDESYVGNPVVYCGCVGLLPIDKYLRETKAGDVALLAGGRTGKEGIHGVTFASAEIGEIKGEEKAAELTFDPPVQERLARAIFRVRDENLASGITDLGGGGISCATGETAYKSGCGIVVDLEKVPLKLPGMAPWEIWISESQDRMFLTIPEKNLERVLEIFEEENVEATPIGKFVRGSSLVVRYQGQEVANLDLQFLFSPPKVKRVAEWKAPKLVEPEFAQPRDLTEILIKLLASANIGSKSKLVKTDESWKNVVLGPFHGEHGGPNDAAIVKPLQDSRRGVVISCGINPNYGRIDPYWMAASNIEEAIRNNVAVGGRRIALLDNFVWGSPEKAEQLGALVRACEACYDFSKAFSAPFISGKDSLYNESSLGPVTPTLLITAIGIIPDVGKAVSLEFKRSGNPLYILGETYRELGGSEYYKLLGFLGKSVPRVRAAKSRKIMESLRKAMDLGYIRACHDLSEGGLGVAVSEMMIGGRGAELDLRKVPGPAGRDDFILFSESNGRFLVEVKAKAKAKFEELMDSCAYSRIGEVIEDRWLSVTGLNGERIIHVEADRLEEAWRRPLGNREE